MRPDTENPLASLRARLGLTRPQLAQKLGVPPSSIAAVEEGQARRGIGRDLFNALAQAGHDAFAVAYAYGFWLSRDRG